MRMVLGMALAATAIWLSSCGGVDEALLEDPAYQLGYNDGCVAATKGTTLGKQDRNQAYAGKSKAYDSGFASGFGSCGGNPTAARRGDVFDSDSHRGREQ
jgi:hypothetical protein